MSDAITNLGGAGLSTPYLANLATSLNYAVSAVVTLFGGPLINKIGIKYACIVAAIMMPLAGSGYYVQARYKGDSYLLSARVGHLFSVALCPELTATGYRRYRFGFLVCRRSDRHALVPSAR